MGDLSDKALEKFLHLLPYDKLLTVRRLADEIISAKQHEVIQSVPEDLWKHIMVRVIVGSLEELLVLGCVSKSWNNCVNMLLLSRFHRRYNESPRLLSKFYHLTSFVSLRLEQSNQYKYDLEEMTSLRRLETPTPIYSVEELPLSHLSIYDNSSGANIPETVIELRASNIVAIQWDHTLKLERLYLRDVVKCYSAPPPMERLKLLDLSRSREAPRRLFQCSFPNLETLILDSANFAGDPVDLSKMPKLQHLSLRNTMMVRNGYLPTSLTKLDLHDYFFTTAPTDPLINLRALSISGEERCLPFLTFAPFLNYDCLETLSVHATPELASYLPLMTNLTALSLYRNDLKNFSVLPALTKLRILFEDMTSLRDTDFSDLTQLTALRLSTMSVSPPTLCQLSNLTYLDLRAWYADDFYVNSGDTEQAEREIIPFVSELTKLNVLLLPDDNFSISLRSFNLTRLTNLCMLYFRTRQVKKTIISEILISLPNLEHFYALDRNNFPISVGPTTAKVHTRQDEWEEEVAKILQDGDLLRKSSQ